MSQPKSHIYVLSAASKLEPLNVAVEVAGLASLTLVELRRRWESEFRQPPRVRSVELLRQMLAWRMQAAVFGGLDPAVRRVLQRPGKCGMRERLSVGDRVSREYRGVRHEVEVVGDGYRYGDEVYESLSAIAREITGVRWNGWRFFGQSSK